MRLHGRYLLIALLAAPVPGQGNAGSESHGLRHNPFERPNISAAPAAGTPAAAEAAARDWKPQLRAVVVAGKDSMVNVDGTIVTLGGQIDGFRLAKVEEQKAIFMKDGVRIELTMDSAKSGGRESRR